MKKIKKSFLKLGNRKTYFERFLLLLLIGSIFLLSSIKNKLRTGIDKIQTSIPQGNYDSQSPTWRRYTNTSYKYTFMYPSNWKIREGSGNNHLQYTTAENLGFYSGKDVYAANSIMVRIDDIKKFSCYQTDLGCFKTTEMEETEVAGRKAYMVDKYLPAEGGEDKTQKLRIVMIRNDNKQYSISQQRKLEAEDKFLDSFNTLLASFGFIDDQVSIYPLTVNPSISPEKIANWNIYTNKLLGYTIRYPSNWSVSEIVENNVPIARFEKNKSTNSENLPYEGRIFFDIHTSKVFDDNQDRTGARKSHESLESWFDRVLMDPYMPTTWAGPTIMRKASLTLGNIKAFKMEKSPNQSLGYPVGTTDDTMTHALYAVEKNQTESIIVQTYVNYWNNRAEFDQLVSTMKLSDN